MYCFFRPMYAFAAVLSVIILTIRVPVRSTWEIRQNGAPFFFSMEKEYEEVASRKEILEFSGRDSTLSHTLWLLSDVAGRPLLFYSDIMTPVCIDGVCKPVHIELYWNLIGNYVGYGLHDSYPLTKYDHELFEPEDYKKFHDLLLDRHSVLERQQLEDLFNAELPAEKKQITFKGEEVDAVSGATKKEIKESVVEGALYSCYTIWHLAHGSVVQQMETYLQKIYAPTIAEYLLFSGYPDYQYYAIQQLDEMSLIQYQQRVLEIFSDASPLVRRYILKKLPDAVWKQPSATEDLYENFSSLDINTKTLLINEIGRAHPSAIVYLSLGVETMSKNQLNQYLQFLSGQPKQPSRLVRRNLNRVLKRGQYTYSYLLEAFLDK